MKVGETVTFPVLKECPSIGAFLWSRHLWSGFSGKAGSEVNTGHIFPQLSPWWEMGQELECLEPELGVSWSFSHAQWLSPSYRDEVGSQGAVAEALRVRSEVILFQVCALLSPSIAPWPQRGTVLEKEGLEQVSGAGQSMCCDGPGAPVRVSHSSQSTASKSTSNGHTCPTQMKC